MADLDRSVPPAAANFHPVWSRWASVHLGSVLKSPSSISNTSAPGRSSWCRVVWMRSGPRGESGAGSPWPTLGTVRFLCSVTRNFYGPCVVTRPGQTGASSCCQLDRPTRPPRPPHSGGPAPSWLFPPMIRKPWLFKSLAVI